MLEKIGERLDEIKVIVRGLADLENRLGGNDSTQVQGDLDLPPESFRHWVEFRLESSPVTGMRCGTSSLEMTMLHGVSRSLETLGLPSPIGQRLISACVADEEMNGFLYSGDWSAGVDQLNGHDVVAIAALFGSNWRDRWKSIHELSSEEVPPFVRDVLMAGLLVAAMAHDPVELSSLKPVWSLPIQRFFEIPGYRSIRRRAARLWGGSGAAWIVMDQGYATDAYAVFAVEWMIAALNSEAAGKAGFRLRHYQLMQYLLS